MATTGKKINELDQISTVTSQTVLPAVYVNNGTPANTATKMTLAQVKDYIELNATPASTINLGPVKVDGDTITIDENNVISSHSGIDAAAAAHAAMPSNTYKDLTPTIGQLLTAPADGYIYASNETNGNPSSGTVRMTIMVCTSDSVSSENKTVLLAVRDDGGTSGDAKHLFAPISKGQKFIVYTNVRLDHLRFVYTNGSESEYQESN